MCNFKAGLAKCAVCFHFRFTSLKRDWKIMHIFSAKKRKSIRKVIHQRAAEQKLQKKKNPTQVLLQNFPLSFFLALCSPMLKIAYCSATFILSPLPTHASCAVSAAAMTAWLLWGVSFSPAEPHTLSHPCLGLLVLRGGHDEAPVMSSRCERA